MKDTESGSALLAYSATRARWRESEFAKRYPSDASYRHTLAEETEALQATRLVLLDRKAPDSHLDPGLRTALTLSADGMLEAYILLNAADEGIAKDYEGYRATHREVLKAYLSKYVVHGPTAAR